MEISAPEVETCFQKAVRRLSQELEIEGFRKGKVPPHMAEKYLRTATLFEEASHIAIQDTYLDVVLHHQLEPIGKPEVELTKIARGNSLAYKIKVPVLEEVELPNWRKIKVKRTPVTPDSQEVEKALDYLQKSRIQYIAVNRSAEKGDFVEIDFTIRQDGVILENGSAQKHPFVLGEGKFAPGFEDALVGMQTGEEKNFPVTFPVGYHVPSLAGKAVKCSVKLLTLLERKLPPRDDVFAKSLGSFETFAELKKNITDGIMREKEEHENSRLRMEAIGQIADKSTMEIPDVLIEREVEKMYQDLEEHVSGTGLGMDAYLQHLKKTKEDLWKDWQSEAEKRVRVALTLRALAKFEQIQLAEEEVQAKMQETIKNFPSPADAKKRFSQDALREYAESVLKNEKVFELIEYECITP